MLFQSYKPRSHPSFGTERIPLVRSLMQTQNLDALIVPHDDEYQNEYVPACAERLMWLSGFSGSAGTAIVTMDRAVFFVDGRYTLQVREQVDNEIFEFVNVSTVSSNTWIADNIQSGSSIGYDPMLHTVDGVAKLREATEKSKLRLVGVNSNIVDEAWIDRPHPPTTLAKFHETQFSGIPSAEKRSRIAETLKDARVDSFLVPTPPSIAWAFNIRGGDIDRMPVPLARALLNADGSGTLFIMPEKVDQALLDSLGNDIDLKAETELDDVLAGLGTSQRTIGLDPEITPSYFYELLNESGAKVVLMTDPCALPKATKNQTEIRGAREAHLRDGVALTRFLQWLDTTTRSEQVDEIQAAQKLEKFRQDTGALCDLSFDTISAAGPHGALNHYTVTTDSNRPLKDGELYLVDSGGQYQDGTTDVTRTIAIGEPSMEMRERFTLVLKGHIAIDTVRFPAGTRGNQLDVLARRPLWETGLDFDHGTGHGVGSYLGVHEGPQRINKKPGDAVLLPGMILSNEPGYYKSGEYGIRIENLVLVQPATPMEHGEHDMMTFETLTLAPICLDLVAVDMLTEGERLWLNRYHAVVREKISPLVDSNVSSWLERATRPV